MRIVSQNKEVDVNYDSVDIQLNDRSRVTYWGKDETYWGEGGRIRPMFTVMASGRVLGDYPTRERALEVMKEIREQAGKNTIYELGMIDKVTSRDKLEFISHFHMPKE